MLDMVYIEAMGRAFLPVLLFALAVSLHHCSTLIHVHFAFTGRTYGPWLRKFLPI
jgi:hypothetical protein